MVSKATGVFSAILVAASLTAVPLTAGGCGRDHGWEDRGDAPKAKAQDEGAVTKLEADAAALWAKRDQEGELVKAIAAYEKVLQAKGIEDYKTLVQLSRANYLLAEMVDDTERKLAAYDTGTKYGDRALYTIPSFRDAIAKGKPIEEAAETVGKDGIEAVYWDAVNSGKWAKAKGITKALFIKDKVRRMYEHVVKLDESWFYGAGHRSLGAFWSALPSISGRDLDKSMKHFEKSLAFGKDYFATRVLIADIWARNANDGKRYKKELKLVLETKAEALPECAQENRVEQRKAKKLLEEYSEYFDEDEEDASGKGAAGGTGS